VDAAATTTWTIGSGYTLLSCVTSNANTNVGAQYRSFSTTVSGQSTAFGNQRHDGWAACAAAVKAATGSSANDGIVFLANGAEMSSVPFGGLY
jgi:hypothetical protein